MEFKRFVSYLYVYQNQVKQKNCGFVRVEIRQNIARFLLHMYLPEKRGTEYNIYGFIRNEGRLDGILLGRGRGKNGSVDVRIQQPADHLNAASQGTGAPGISIEQLSGILVTTEEGDLYGTVWDDAEIDVSTFRPQREKRAETSAEQEKRAETGRQQEAEEKPAETVRQQEAKEEWEVTGRQQETAEKRAETGRQQEIENKEQQMKTARQKESRANRQQKTEIRQEQWTAAENDRQKQRENVSEAEAGNPAENADASRQLQVQELQQNMDWDIILKQCPSVQPFEQEAPGKYFRIEPKDLKYLPKSMWHLGRNSFLLHGYYNYRYLILGKEERGIMLGVPGVYYPMEESVAAMFGFRSFHAAQGRPVERGIFGYWCRHFTDR